jgi:3-oxoacyl-[acyl-carrier-protein] synthase II
MNRIAVTGIGVVSAAAVGRSEYARVVAIGPPPEPHRRIAGFALENHLSDARPFRRVARATGFTVAAAAMALSDAGLAPGASGGERTVLIVGVTHGALEYSAHFHHGLLVEGPAGASPLHFSESVLNAPAGNAAIAFGIRGSVHTLIGEETVGTEAIALAAILLRTGQADRCLVAGTEERSELVDAAYRRMHRAATGRGGAWEILPVPGEGAAALVLELCGTAARRGAKRHALLSGWASESVRGDSMEETTVAVVEAAFRRGGVVPGDTGHFLPPTGGHRAAAERGAARALASAVVPPVRIDIRRIIGNPVGAANLFQAAASAASLSAGNARGRGLVVSTGMEGTVAALVLSGADREETG